MSYYARPVALTNGGTGTTTAFSGLVKSNSTAFSAAGASDLNSTFGSQTQNFVYAAPSGSSGNPTFRLLAAVDIPTLTVSKISDYDTATRAYRLDQFAAPTSAVSFNAQRITTLADPTAAQDAATKNYVDNKVSGLTWKAAVHAATTASLTFAAGGNPTLDTITSAPSVLDGVTLVSGDRILVKNQATASQNGIYTVTTLGTGVNGVWTRSADFTGTSANSYQVPDDAAVFVEAGTTAANTGWVVSSVGTGTNQALTIDTDSVTWAQFTGAGTYTFNGGLTATGNTVSVQIDAASSSALTTSNSGVKLTTSNITSVGTISSGTWQGTTIGIAYGGTGATSASAAFNNLSPNTTLGDITYGSGTNTNTRLPGNTTAVKQFLTQTGNGSVSAAPAWGAIADGDLPTTLSSHTISGGTFSGTIATSGLSLGGFTLTGNLGLTQNSILTGSSNQFTLSLPQSTDTIVGRATTDTLTNKTLTSPALGGSVTGTYNLGGTYNIQGTPTLAATLALGGQTLSGTATFSGAVSHTGGDTFTQNNLATTLTDAITVNNTTASTGGATSQISPSIHLSGTSWSGSASQSIDFRTQVMSTGTSTFKYSFQSSIAGGAFSERAYIDHAGNVVATGNLSLASGGTINAWTLPNITDTFVGRASTDTLTNKTLTSPAFNTSQILNAAGGNYTLTWANPGAARAISIPDPGATDVFVFAGMTQTLSNKTLASPALSGSISGTYNIGGTPTLTSNLALGSNTLSGTPTFSGNTTFSSNIIASSIGTASGTGQLTIPAATSDTIATLALTQTLSNKTISAVTDGLTVGSTQLRVNAAGGSNGGIVGVGTATPSSVLQVAGPIATALSTKTTSYTITDTDSIILADATSGAITITLPAVGTIVGRQYIVKKIDSSANTVTITRNGTPGTDTIDGATTQVIAVQYDSLTLVADGSGHWFIV